MALSVLFSAFLHEKNKMIIKKQIISLIKKFSKTTIKILIQYNTEGLPSTWASRASYQFPKYQARS